MGGKVNKRMFRKGSRIGLNRQLQFAAFALRNRHYAYRLQFELFRVMFVGGLWANLISVIDRKILFVFGRRSESLGGNSTALYKSWMDLTQQ